MNRYSFFTILCLCAGLPITSGAFFEDAAPAPISGANASFETAFTSLGTLSPLVVKELVGAKKSIRISAREFTSKPVSEALVKAARAGADLKIVLNKKTNTGVDSAALFLQKMSYPPHMTKSEDGLYSDYIIIDERDIILGNVAGFADEEDEKGNVASVLVIHNAPELAKQYLADWQALWNASEEMPKEK